MGWGKGFEVRERYIYFAWAELEYQDGCALDPLVEIDDHRAHFET